MSRANEPVADAEAAELHALASRVAELEAEEQQHRARHVEPLRQELAALEGEVEDRHERLVLLDSSREVIASLSGGVQVLAPVAAVFPLTALLVGKLGFGLLVLVAAFAAARGGAWLAGRRP